MCAELLGHVRLFATPVEKGVHCSPSDSSVHRVPQARILSGLLSSPPGDLPNPEIEPVSLMSPELASRSFTTSAIWEVYSNFPFIDKEN